MSRIYSSLFTFLLILLTLGALPSCDNRNINDVIRQMAEAPVDTTGYARREWRMGTFSAVQIDCFADVSLHQIVTGTTPRIVLLAPDEVLDKVIAKVTDETLLLTLQGRYQMPDDVAVVAHIYAPFLSRIEFNGGKCLRMPSFRVACPLEIHANGLGAIMADSLESHDLSVESNGAGSMHFNGINTHTVRFECNGSGKIVLSGNCQKGSIAANGVGMLDVAGLKSSQSMLQINANGVGSVRK